jgi:S1-C subfamily serine protease
MCRGCDLATLDLPGHAYWFGEENTAKKTGGSMSQESASNASSKWRELSNESANIVEKGGRGVVAVHARRRIPASGVHWRPGIVVTTHHSIERDEEIAVTLPGGRTIPATLAGRDPSTDLAILKLEGAETATLARPEIGDISLLKPGHWIFLAGRTAEGGTRAGSALVSVVGPAWRTWRGGQFDLAVRLDGTVHPNFTGGPAIDDQGRILGIVTSGLSRYAAVVIPASTIERVAAELEKKGHIGRGYLGVGMQAVRLPRKLRDALKLAGETGIMIVGVEPEGPAEKAGVQLGDVIVAFDSSPMCDISDVQTYLAGDRIGKATKVRIIRGGALVEATLTVSERPDRS